MIDWFGDSNWTANSKSTPAGTTFEAFEKAVEDGPEVTDWAVEKEFLWRGRSVVQFRHPESSKRISQIGIVRLGNHEPQAFRYGRGQWRGCVLADLDALPEFDVHDRTFSSAFKALLLEDAYKDLLDDSDSDRPWYDRDRVRLMERFWRELRGRMAKHGG